jgi:SAM-dependent methyltransferase
MDLEAYAEHYRHEERHWWFRGRLRVIWALLGRAGLPEHPRILDAGCGTGRNLVEFGRLGTAHGVDASETAVEFCRRRGLDGVRLGRLEALPFEEDSFDLLLACDVLEHVPDDLPALRELRRVAAPGASLLITVPAYRWLWSKHDVQLHHHRRYTLRGLREHVRAAGWDPVVDSYFMTVLLPAVAATRLLDRATGRTPDSDLDRTPPVLNRLFESPAQLEAAVIARGGRLPAGVSIGAVCR